MSTSGRDRLLADLQDGLDQRTAAGLFRAPQQVQGVDFTSNDYLGFARDIALADLVADGVRVAGIGLTGSRLLSGESALTGSVERELAALSGQDAAVVFSSGYAANLGLLSGLLRATDHVVSDSLNHASLIDGMRLTRAHKHLIPHGDLEVLERVLSRLPASGRRVVVVESVYSMDGDLTDLTRVCDIADASGAAVIVDEAHATGLYGGRLSGRVEALGLTNRVVATIHTGGKALGCGGAWVAGSETLAKHLHNHARSFIYSTAPVPALFLSLRASVARLGEVGDVAVAVKARAKHLREKLTSAGYDVGRSESCIVPVLLGGNDRAMEVAAKLVAEGFNVRAIRPPTVPVGTSRIRLAVGAHISDSDIDALVAALVRVDQTL